MPSSTCTECTTSRDYPCRTPFGTSCSRREFGVLATQSGDESCLYSTGSQTLWACDGALLHLAVAAVAIVVANCERFSWLKRLCDIVQPKLDNLLSNMCWMATDMEHTMWTALVTISHAFVAMSVCVVKKQSVKQNYHHHHQLRVTYRASLWPCIIVNRTIASWRHCTWFGIRRLSIRSRSGRHQKSLTNVADYFALILWIFMRWPCHVAVWECRRQWWRWVGIHANCLIVFVLQVSEVKIFIVIAFWSGIFEIKLH